MYTNEIFLVLFMQIYIFEKKFTFFSAVRSCQLWSGIYKIFMNM